MSRLLPLQTGVIYGPVESRRLGRSLGINLMPTGYKVCSFNCVYCHYGWTRHLTCDLSPYAHDLPTVDRVEAELVDALRVSRVPPQYITFSGNGEPTLHPEFDVVVDRLLAVRERMCPGVKIAVLSNSTGVRTERVREALAKIDARIMKLDAGNDEVARSVNRPACEMSLERIVDGLAGIENIVLQSVFVAGEITNADESSLGDWIGCVRRIKPTSVQVYTLDRAPAMSTLKAVPAERLAEIAYMLKGVGVDARAY